MRRIVARGVAAAATLSVLLTASVGWAFDEPTGYGKAKFGVSPEAFEKLYPKAQRLSQEGVAQDAGGTKMLAYRLEKQKVGTLRDCRVDFRFFGVSPEMYEVQFLCPDKEGAARYLTQEFGTPSKVTSTALMWNGTRGSVSFVPKAGAFSYGDVGRSRTMQLYLFKSMGMSLGGAKPAPNPAQPPVEKAP